METGDLKVVAVIQARMGSTRLPGKVLMDLGGEPMLARVVSRTRRARSVDEVVVATTTQAADDAIVRLCGERGWLAFRGGEDDVLDRYHQAALWQRADVVVRVTSDCPLIEPDNIDRIVGEYLRQMADYDYAHNGRSFAHGVADCEVFPRAVLERAWSEALLKSEREHVTSYIWRNTRLFRVLTVESEQDFGHLRLVVDHESDLKLVRAIYEAFRDREGAFGFGDVVGFLRANPELLDLNRGIQRDEGFLRSLKMDG